MLFFNHPYFKYEPFFVVHSLDAIAQTPPNSIIQTTPQRLDIIKHCQANTVGMALEVQSIKEALFANAWGARYLLCDLELAKEVQPLAEYYLFDTKVLVWLEHEDQIEEAAQARVDGVIFR